MNVDQYVPVSRTNTFMYSVYAWMACALALTALTAHFVFATPALYQALALNSKILFLIIIVQLVLVVLLSVYIMRLSFTSAVVAFLSYSVLLGILLSSIFEIYTTASIFVTFLITALMFGVTALYGYVTKSDLTTVGNIALMFLFGLIIAMLVNLFFQNPMIDLVISGIGILVFTLLTAYDVQKLKRMSNELLGAQEVMAKVSILGALTLYLDFVNLFLYLLRFMGKRKK